MTGEESLWGQYYGPAAKGLEGPCLYRFASAVAAGAGVGTFMGACQVAWYPDPVVSETKKMAGAVIAKSSDSGTVIRGMIRPAMWMAAAGSAFAMGECLAETFRNKSDSWNAVVGGMASGAVMGATTRRFDIMTAAALGMGLVMGIVDASGPATVHNQEGLAHKMHGTLPETHQETEALASLKEKYPQYKHI
mmetsp:Transcript_27344/g.38496  ORF Transcript_27344/g.38496 Transcript_27344/m.38496 type:complete len:192 (+) Transcript_27344:63-638(+)